MISLALRAHERTCQHWRALTIANIGSAYLIALLAVNA